MTIDAILVDLVHAHEASDEHAFFDLFRRGADASQTPDDWNRFRETLTGLGLGEVALPDSR